MKKCIYILLPVHNRRELTRDFIDCLVAQTCQNYHLVLIDDGSTDGTEQVVRERVENLTVIRGNGNWWWAGCLQQGFNFLKKKGLSYGDYVLIANDDVVFGKEFLAKGVSILDKNKQTLLLAQVQEGDNLPPVETGAYADLKTFSFSFTAPAEDINCLPTRCLFLKWEDFVDIGGFHPIILPHYFSDKDWPVQSIPNGLDTTFWTPADNTHIRDTLGLPKDKQIILFSANQFKQGHIKGFDLLKEALSLLPKEKMSDVELLVFGADIGGSLENEGYPINYLGYVDNPLHLRDLYRSADVMLVPSRMESFGQTASEAHACGIPVVAFDASGTADIVDHMKTGYLARAFDVNDFCAGILWVLENDQRRKPLGLEARRKAENRFDHLLVAKEHIKTYEKVLNV